MVNLNILNETRLRQKQDNSRQKSKEESRLEREKNKAMDKIQKITNSKNKEIEETYTRRTSATILEQLKSDYQTLQERSVLMNIDPDVLSKAKEISSQLEAIENDEERERTRKIMRHAVEKDIINTMELLEEKGTLTGDITSYLTYDETNKKCLLISPTDGDDNKQLSEGLEQILTEIMIYGDITTALTSTADQGVVADTKTRHIKFKGDFTFEKGFLVYEVECNNPREPIECFTNELKKKIEDSQPESFKNTGLTHKIIRVESPIIDFLINHPEKEMYQPIDELYALQEKGELEISVELASELLGKRPQDVKKIATMGKLEYTGEDKNAITISSLEKYMGQNEIVGPQILNEPTDRKTPTIKRETKDKLTYSSKDLTERRQEAQTILERYDKDELDTEEIRDILGLTNRTTIPGLLKEGIIEGAYKKGWEWVVPKESLTKYINERDPTKAGWKVSK